MSAAAPVTPSWETSRRRFLKACSSVLRSTRRPRRDAGGAHAPRRSERRLGRTLRRHLWLPERERVSLGAGLEERDLQRALADPVVLTDELVPAAVPEQAVPVIVDVHAC